MRARKSGWKILGAGVNGVVFDNGKMVRKFTEIQNRSEYNAMKKLESSGANYVPKVHELNIGKGYTMYSMNRLPPNTVTLHTYLAIRPQFKILARNMLKEIVEDMHERGISHGDLHDNNIMVTEDDKGNIKKMWIIDFGRVVEIPKGKTELQSYAGLKKTNLHGYGLVFGPSMRYSRPDIKLTGVPLYNFKRGLTTLNNQGRKVYAGPNGRFRLENGKKIPVKVKRTIAVRPITPPKTPSPVREMNGLGRLIHIGPKGGLYVLVNGKRLKPAKGRATMKPKVPTPKAKTPTPKAKSKPKEGDLNSKGRLIHKGPLGGLYVIHNGKKIYKK
jgi:serine/threonine protein kinase